MNVYQWILNHDVFVQYLAKRDLADIDPLDLCDLRKRILTEGYGYKLQSKQDLHSLMWGEGIYSPKYISTHYSLLELCQIGACLNEERYQLAIKLLYDKLWADQGQIKAYRHQDLCVVAMMIRISAHANYQDMRLNDMVDYILDHQMDDGGWNCAWERKKKPKQSSLHTTISVLEAFNAYLKHGYLYRKDEIRALLFQAIEYLLSKKLFRSVRTNEIIDKDMLVFSFPYNWRYDILRALNVMVDLEYHYDQRVDEALSIMIERLDSYGRIKADRKPPSLQHFRYTNTGELCPYNTYRVLKVLKYYRPLIYQKYLLKPIK